MMPQEGYDLSSRGPGPGHLKHKYVASDSHIDSAIKPAGGAKKCVCGPETAQMHWNALK